MKEILGGRYGVDSNGTIYSLRNNAGNRRTVPYAIRRKPTREGYFTCGVYEDIAGVVVRRTLFVHRLVAQAYHANPDNKPEVNHKDGCKGHNWPDNLEWATKRENALHAFELGLRNADAKPYAGKFNQDHPRSRPIRQLTMAGETVQIFPSAQEAKRQGFSQPNISSVISGRRQSHKGFRWAFA